MLNNNETRNKLFDKFKEKRTRELGNKFGKDITITLNHSNQVVIGKSFQTTPYNILLQSFSEEDRSTVHHHQIVARVNGKLWDMNRVLEGDCKIEFSSDWNDVEVRRVFKQSSALVLAAAIEQVFESSCLNIGGSPIEDDYGKGGFFYDHVVNGLKDRSLSENDWSQKIKKVIEKILEEKIDFERLIVRKYEALELFAGNDAKIELLNQKFNDSDFLCVYRCGNFIDTSMGPHLLHTGQIACLEITSSTKFVRSFSNETTREIQRTYGISFPTEKQMDEWKIMSEKLKLCNHKKIGKDQELWFSHPYSPGMISLLPHGKRLCNSILNLLRETYWNHGFLEVQGPTILSKILWYPPGLRSGSSHNIFSIEIDKAQYLMKPTNKPVHCIMYQHRNRSYRELPIRYVEIGTVFQDNLQPFGMNRRLRSFQKDESTIFCQPHQTKREILNCLQMITSVYNKFGFQFKIVFYTKPNYYHGDTQEWVKFEGMFEAAVKTLGYEYERDEGGAPYFGPRIEIYVADTLKRFVYICGIVQLDFNTPVMFDLNYTTSDNSVQSQRPICINSTIMNCVETFLALSSEQCGGKWPFWISPRQVVIIPLCENCIEYSERVQEIIHQAGYYIDVDLSLHTFEKKIRNAHLAQYNYILIIGENEMATESVNVRMRDGEIIGIKTIVQLLEEFKIKD